MWEKKFNRNFLVSLLYVDKNLVTVKNCLMSCFWGTSIEILQENSEQKLSLFFLMEDEQTGMNGSMGHLVSCWLWDKEFDINNFD